jgi:hypothetical protein
MTYIERATSPQRIYKKIPQEKNGLYRFFREEVWYIIICLGETCKIIGVNTWKQVYKWMGLSQNETRRGS